MGRFDPGDLLAAPVDGAPAGALRDPLGGIQDIPTGMVVSTSGGAIELPEYRRQDFVLIQSDADHLKVWLLCSDAAYGHPAMYDVRQRALKAGYRPEIVRVTPELIKIANERPAQRRAAEDDDTEIERLITRIVDDAHAQGASDIHIESRGEQAEMLFRVNGIRASNATLARTTAHALGKVLYVHADAASKDITWDPNVVADGALEWTTSAGVRLQLRFSSAPIYPAGNFHIVLRLLRLENVIPPIDALGFDAGQIELLDRISAGSGGIVLLCGPTNSGKSTTLQSVIGRLHERRGREIKIITVEDPVEYVIPGACQIPVARKRALDGSTGTAFTAFLRGTLRQDPDVVMVGEIRDLDGARITKDLVLSGRKIFASLHANSAFWAFPRLREIGLPWEILTMPEFIAGTVYQRLLPRLCPHCSMRVSKQTHLPPGLRERMQYVVDFSVDEVRTRGEGCPDCRGTGIVGRTVVAEILIPDRHLLTLLAENRVLEAERHWRHGIGATSLMQNTLAKMRRGEVDPVDIENLIAPLISKSSDVDFVAPGYGEG